MLHRSILLPIAIICALPLAAGSKVFKDTSDYKKELKGHLNLKFDTYAHMYEEPKGTECDWVFVDPAFNLDDLRKETITTYVDSITNVTPWTQSYWGTLTGFWGNGIVRGLEIGLQAHGLKFKRAESPTTMPEQLTKNPSQAAFLAVARDMNTPPELKAGIEAQMMREMPVQNELQKKIEMDRYEEEKKNLGFEEAAKRAEERERKRKDEWKQKIQSMICGEKKSGASVGDQPIAPEEQKGWVMVMYLTESNTHAAFGWAGTTTTGEFILLKDGKPMMAARHNSVGSFSESGTKCGQALSTAFDIKMKKK